MLKTLFPAQFLVFVSSQSSSSVLSCFCVCLFRRVWSFLVFSCLILSFLVLFCFVLVLACFCRVLSCLVLAHPSSLCPLPSMKQMQSVCLFRCLCAAKPVLAIFKLVLLHFTGLLAHLPIIWSFQSWPQNSFGLTTLPLALFLYSLQRHIFSSCWHAPKNWTKCSSILGKRAARYP